MTRSLTCTILLTAFLLLPRAHESNAQGTVDSRARPIVITHVNVIPMDREVVLADQTVIIREGKISAIGKAVKAPKGAFIIDGNGKYIIPGLAEMHAHVPPVDDLEPMKEVLALFTMNGITTIRGMLGHPRHLELRAMLKDGRILGPHFYSSGPSFNGMSITSPEAGAEAVIRQKKEGYDYLKLHPGLSRAKFDSIASAAKRIGIPFVGHVSSGVGVWRAIEAGYSSIDHLDGFVEGLVPGIEKKSEQETGLFGMFVASEADTSKIGSLMSALRDNRIWVVPTQALAERWFSPAFSTSDFRNDPHSKYMKKETVEQWSSSKENLLKHPQYNADQIGRFINLRRRLIKACQENGVGLLLGCDAPQVFNVPGFSTHHELEYLVRSGLSPFEALQTGTVNVAKYLGQPNTGVINTNANADLILLAGNPLRDIRNTQTIQGVMVKGVWLSPDYISSELKKLEK